MDNRILIIASSLALFLMLAFSFYMACLTVKKATSVCQSRKKVEGEVLLDDICEKYLKLTNADDMLPPWPAVRNEDEPFEEFIDKGSDALIKNHEGLVKKLI